MRALTATAYAAAAGSSKRFVYNPSSLLQCPKFRTLDAALSSTLYQMVSHAHQSHTPSAAMLPRAGMMRRRGPRLESEASNSKVEIQELPLAFNAATAEGDEEAKFRKARDGLREARDEMSHTVRTQQLSNSALEPRLQEIQTRESALRVERAALERSVVPSQYDRSQQHFENNVLQDDYTLRDGQRHPMVGLGQADTYSFPYQETRHKAFAPFGGLSASINPHEPSGDGRGVASLRMAAIDEELRRLEREKYVLDHREYSLHKEVDSQSKSILGAEKKLAEERDEALQQRSKRADLLQGLQQIVARYSNFFAGMPHHA